jgi:hypothetical protein
MKGLERIQSEFKKSSIKYHLRRVIEESVAVPSNASDAMVSLILSKVKSD